MPAPPRPFAKYEGLGNDFVVLEARDWPLEQLTPALARALCDRHRGIGADGVLWLEAAAAGPAADAARAARLVILNADGSRPEMCGNGVRCVAAYLYDQGHLAPGAHLALETDAGPRPARVVEAGVVGGAVEVEVDMGPVRLDAREAALALPDGAAATAVAVDVGNPHAVVFAPVPEAARMDVVRALEAERALFPRGVNVEFVAPLPEAPAGARAGYRVDVHERGVGWTQACGTGACAVAAAAALRPAPQPRAAADAPDRRGAGALLGAPIAVDLAGGRLLVTIEPRPAGREAEPAGEPAWRARMRGPARRVFNGTVVPPA